MRYTYEELIEDLEMGMEVEFFYNQRRYSISHNTKGWYLSQYGEERYQTFHDYEELLENAVIESKKLDEIWHEVRF